MTFTDDHVRTLPLDRGKAELLDELLTRARGRGRCSLHVPGGDVRWQVAVAAAAAVAVAVAGPVLLFRGGDDPATSDGRSRSTTVERLRRRLDGT